MNPGVVRQVLLPLHERLMRRDTLAIVHRLEASPLTTEQLSEVQRQGLQRILDHARGEIPYWRERLAGRLGPPLATDPAAVLAPVPLLTRSEMRRNLEAMRWQAALGKVLLHSSSGTTDDNLSFYWGRARQSWDRAVRLRALKRHGIHPGDRTLHLWPRSPADDWPGRLKLWARDARDWLINDVVLDLRPFSPERLDAVLSRCASYDPALIISYPSWLVTLGEYIREARPRFRWRGLRLILCMGEVLFAFQRRLIAETFGVPVYQEYGSQDAGLIAHEDPQGVLRLNGEQMVVEVLRDGVPARPGQLGEVVVTHFYTDVMPFIRYATGDVVLQPEGPLPANEPGLPVFPLPQGRTSDMLATADQALVPMRPVVEALVEHAGLWAFSLFQDAVGRVIVLEVEGRNGIREKRGEAEDILRSFLGRQLVVEWRTGKRFVPLKSGKRRYVCSPVGMSLIAHDREAGLSLARAWPQRLEDDVV